MESSFRVAVIGCGSICGNHIAAIQAAGETVAALCDTVAEHAQAIIEKYHLHGVPVYADYLELLDREHPDAVHICTPHYLHAEMCLAALSRNIHVLCEKPLAIHAEQLDALARAVQSSRAQLGVCLQNRYEPNMLRLKELAQDGVRGGCGFVVWKRDADYYRSGAWRGTVAEEGGGVMINQALHTLDILQWVCGMPTHLTAHLSNDHLAGEIEVEDTAAALLELSDGTRLNFFATTAGNADFPIRLQLTLRDGRCVDAGNDLLAVDGAPLPVRPGEVAPGKLVWGTGHKLLIADFYDCIRAGRPFPIGVAEASKVMRLILAMYRSNGSRVETV